MKVEITKGKLQLHDSDSSSCKVLLVIAQLATANGCLYHDIFAAAMVSALLRSSGATRIVCFSL
jgi:hypothetical protein